MPHISRHAATTLASLLLGSTSALAVEAQPFAERLQSVLAEQGVPMEFTGAEEQGDDVVIQGMTVASAEGEPTAFGDVTFEGVTGSPADGYVVESVPFDDVDVTNEGTRTQIRGMAIEGLEIAGTTDDPERLGSLYFERAAIDNIDVERDGQAVFTLAGTEITNTYPDGGSFTSDFQLGDFTINFTAGKDEAGTQVMRELGYDTLSGSSSGTATWDPATGELALDPFTIAAEDAGELRFSYAITGYTPSFIESLSQIQAQMAANPENQEAAGMAIIGLISQLSLNSVDLAYEDASLADRLLDYYAEQNGVSRDEFVANLNAMVPPMIAALQNPEFQEDISSAAATFLADPQSLSVSIDPAQPIPATQIIGAAVGAPQTLPDVLDIEISANGGTAASPAATDEPPAAQDEPAAEDSGADEPAATESDADAETMDEPEGAPGRN